jgi:hypothetical protein
VSRRRAASPRARLRGLIRAYRPEKPSDPLASFLVGASGEGRDWRKYLPLTHVEQWVPVIFALSYLVGFCAVAFR